MTQRILQLQEAGTDWCEVDNGEDLAAARVIATYDDTATPGVIETTEAKNDKIARNTKKDITIGIKAAVGDETKYSKFKLPRK